MEHPFTQKTELDSQATEAVSGGNSRFTVSDSANVIGSKLRPVIKPPIATTMALGEEGGIDYNAF